MSEITQSLVAHGGLLLFAVVFVDQAGLPLPSAPWLLAAGALSASGRMNPAAAMGMSVVACLIADALWFYAGRRGGDRILRFIRIWSWVPDSGVKRTKAVAKRHGLPGLVIAKFLPGLGSVMPTLAGALGVTPTSFLLFDALGAVLYGAFYIMAGFLLHNQLQQALALLKQFGFSALLLTVVLVLSYIAFKYARRALVRRISPAETRTDASTMSTTLTARTKSDVLARVKAPARLSKPVVPLAGFGDGKPTIPILAHRRFAKCFGFAGAQTPELKLVDRTGARCRTKGIFRPCLNIFSKSYVGEGI
jgi:membrane protein DedA with SNARE-associated domain